MKELKEAYEMILILTYGLNFFGGGFFYSVLILRNENNAALLAMFYMVLSLFLYIKMDIDEEVVFEAVKRPCFQIIILATYFLPIILNNLTPTK